MPVQQLEAAPQAAGLFAALRPRFARLRKAGH
jgi:hypothetical protein